MAKKSVHDLGPNEGIICRTEAETTAIRRLMDEQGLRWGNGGERYTEWQPSSYGALPLVHFPLKGLWEQNLNVRYTYHEAADFLPEPATYPRVMWVWDHDVNGACQMKVVTCLIGNPDFPFIATMESVDDILAGKEYRWTCHKNASDTDPRVKTVTRRQAEQMLSKDGVTYKISD